MSDERARKNEIFQRPDNVDPGVPVMTTAAAVKAEFGTEIPVDVVPLPSNGKLYPVEHPFHGAESVEIYNMTTKSEDILSSQAYLKKGTVITELIKSCLVDKRVNPSELLAGDRNALMVAIRITGYGADYPAEVTCTGPDCDAKTERTFDLLQLPIKRLAIEPVADGLNLFDFKLPFSQKLVKFRFLTGADEQDMTATRDKQKKLNLGTENSVTLALQRSIVSVDGVEDKNKISLFVSSMHARDSHALRTYIRTNEPGISMKQDSECPQCGHVEKVSVPLGTQFFWPHAGD